MQAPTSSTDAQPLQTSGLAEVVGTKASCFHENEAAKRKGNWTHQQVGKTTPSTICSVSEPKLWGCFRNPFSVVPSGDAALSSARALATLLLQYHSARMLTLKQAQLTATLVKHRLKNQKLPGKLLKLKSQWSVAAAMQTRVGPLK